MADIKVMTICHSGGEFEADSDGSMSYIGGKAHVVEIGYQTKLNDFKKAIEEFCGISHLTMSLEYIFPIDQKTVITICHDKDLQQMIKLHGCSPFCTPHIKVMVVPTSAPDISNLHLPGTGLLESASPANAPAFGDLAPSASNVLLVDVVNDAHSIDAYGVVLHEVPDLIPADISNHSGQVKMAPRRQNTITGIRETHTCEGAFQATGRQATTRWIANVIREKMMANLNYTNKDIVRDIKEDYGITIKEFQACRGKKSIGEEVAFYQLPLICNKIRDTNPGSIVHLQTKSDSSFHRLFVALHLLLHLFQNGCCRPVLFIDRVCIGTKYQQTLFTATGLLGNDEDIPVAMAVVDAENSENWLWFLTKLKSALSEIAAPASIMFVTGAQTWIKDSIAEVFPGSPQRYCISHLFNDFMRCVKGLKIYSSIINHLFYAARAPKPDRFQECLERIKSISPEAYEWVVKIDSQIWADAFFEGLSYFDAPRFLQLNPIQRTPITEIGKLVRRKEKLLDLRRRLLGSFSYRLWSRGPTLLKEEGREAGYLEVNRLCDSSSFEVWGSSDEPVEKVNIDTQNHKGDCSCRVWQLTGVPCRHAIAVIKFIDANRVIKFPSNIVYDYCSQYVARQLQIDMSRRVREGTNNTRRRFL